MDISVAKDTGDSPVYAGMASMRPDKTDMPEKSEGFGEEEEEEKEKKEDAEADGVGQRRG
jgi:hypothetical protein